MTGIERLETLTSWFNLTCPQGPAIGRLADRFEESRTARDLDYFATVEVAWQMGHFGDSVPLDEWESVVEDLQKTEWSLIRANFGSRRAELVQRLGERFEQAAGDSWSVPPDLLSTFFQLSARPDVRKHFGDFDQAMTTLPAREIIETLRDPEATTDALFGSTTPLKTALMRLNEVLEFAVLRYNLVRACGEWPVIQRSVEIYFEDPSRIIQDRASLVENSIVAMFDWLKSPCTSQSEATTIREHLEMLRECTSAMFISEIAFA